MTETLYRTALSVGGRQGGQELEATQTEKPLSDLDFLVLNGMDTAEILKHLNDGITLEELANAARGIVSRGESLANILIFSMDLLFSPVTLATSTFSD